MVKRLLLIGFAFVLLLALYLVVDLMQQRDFPEYEGDASDVADGTNHEGMLYGRVTSSEGRVYEGRLRWAGGEEAFWGDAFNGFKIENPWAGLVEPEAFVRREPVTLFGIQITEKKRRINLDRPFMARFGDIARVEARGGVIRVVLKSGTTFDLDRYAADDLADGVRIWDAEHGVVDLVESRVSVVEFLPTARLGGEANRLHGTVQTRDRTFTGFVHWNRIKGAGSDELVGRTSEGDTRLRFDTIRSITPKSRYSSLVSLKKGEDVALSNLREVGEGNRGLFVDDPRYGRVLVSWEAFERVDFSPDGSGPAYDDFPPGSPLAGQVTTRDGRRLSGRLVFDLDESETTETLDAPSQGVQFTIPFGLVAAIEPRGVEGQAAQKARLTLHGGETLLLDASGDLSEDNAGMLIFSGEDEVVYVAWADVARVDLEPPTAMYPPRAGRNEGDESKSE